MNTDKLVEGRFNVAHSRGVTDKSLGIDKLGFINLTGKFIQD